MLKLCQGGDLSAKPGTWARCTPVKSLAEHREAPQPTRLPGAGYSQYLLMPWWEMLGLGHMQERCPGPCWHCEARRSLRLGPIISISRRSTAQPGGATRPRIPWGHWEWAVLQHTMLAGTPRWNIPTCFNKSFCHIQAENWRVLENVKKHLETLGVLAEPPSSPLAEIWTPGAFCLTKDCYCPDIKHLTTCSHLAADVDGIFSSWDLLLLKLMVTGLSQTLPKSQPWLSTPQGPAQPRGLRQSCTDKRDHGAKQNTGGVYCIPGQGSPTTLSAWLILTAVLPWRRTRQDATGQNAGPVVTGQPSPEDRHREEPHQWGLKGDPPPPLPSDWQDCNTARSHG